MRNPPTRRACPSRRVCSQDELVSSSRKGFPRDEDNPMQERSRDKVCTATTTQSPQPPSLRVQQDQKTNQEDILQAVIGGDIGKRPQEMEPRKRMQARSQGKGKLVRFTPHKPSEYNCVGVQKETLKRRKEKMEDDLKSQQRQRRLPRSSESPSPSTMQAKAKYSVSKISRFQ